MWNNFYYSMTIMISVITYRKSPTTRDHRATRILAICILLVDMQLRGNKLSASTYKPMRALTTATLITCQTLPLSTMMQLCLLLNPPMHQWYSSNANIALKIVIGRVAKYIHDDEIKLPRCKKVSQVLLDRGDARVIVEYMMLSLGIWRIVTSIGSCSLQILHLRVQVQLFWASLLSSSLLISFSLLPGTFLSLVKPSATSLFRRNTKRSAAIKVIMLSAK